jgi:hypothetical protein
MDPAREQADEPPAIRYEPPAIVSREPIRELVIDAAAGSPATCKLSTP